MGRDEIKAFLRAIRAQRITRRGPNWVQASCPLAPWTHERGHDRNPSFGIEVKADAESGYHCFSCGGGDSLVTLVLRLQDHGAGKPHYDLKTAMELASADGTRPLALHIKPHYGEEEQRPEIRFPERLLQRMPSALEIRSTRAYLKTRQVTPRVCREADLRYDWQHETIVFPVRDFGGVLRQLRGRLIEASNIPYFVYPHKSGRQHATVWYGEPWVDFDKPVVMCESVFDVLSVRRVYSNVCAPMVCSVSIEKVQRMWQAIDIVLLMDRGRGGRLLRDRLRWGLSRASIVDVEVPEAYKDPGEIPREELRSLLAPYVKVDS